MKLLFFRVQGSSMSPAFLHNDYIMAYRTCTTSYSEGDVVIVEHERFDTIIKRVQKIENDCVFLSGDNPASTSAEKIGWQSLDNVIAKVIWRFSNRSICWSFFKRKWNYLNRSCE